MALASCVVACQSVPPSPAASHDAGFAGSDSHEDLPTRDLEHDLRDVRANDLGSPHDVAEDVPAADRPDRALDSSPAARDVAADDAFDGAEVAASDVGFDAPNDMSTAAGDAGLTHDVAVDVQDDRADVIRDTGSDVARDGSGYTRPAPIVVTPAARFDPEALSLPRDDAGLYPLLEVPGLALAFDPNHRDALSTLGECASTISQCVETPRRSLDACAVYAPTCATSRPWEEPAACCPVACRDAYESARRAGLSPLEAFDDVYFQRPDCFPGVNALLGRTP